MSNYQYKKHTTKPAYSSSSSHRSATSPTHHSRAQTYAKSGQQQNNHRYNRKPQHLPSNSIAATNTATLNDIETTRSDMRDILWQVLIMINSYMMRICAIHFEYAYN